MQSIQREIEAGAGTDRAGDRPEASSSLIDEGVIHDLLNPLTGLMGHLQLLQELLEDGAFELSRQRIKGCFDSLSILLGMLFDLQQLLRLNAAAVQPNREQISVLNLMSELRTAYDSSIDADQRELVIDCPDGELTVCADAPLLSRALVLLLAVGRRLSRQGPVVIRVSPSGGMLKFEVSYQGMTLPPPWRLCLAAKMIARAATSGV